LLSLEMISQRCDSLRCFRLVFAADDIVVCMYSAPDAANEMKPGYLMMHNAPDAQCSTT
jgi:hypothetical protein